MWRAIVAGVLACLTAVADAAASDTLSLSGTVSIAVSYTHLTLPTNREV